MRCKPGQLAWISNTDPPLADNLGKIVRVLTIDPLATRWFNEPTWECECPAGMLVADGYGQNVRRFDGNGNVCMPDGCLTPINDPDMDVEHEDRQEHPDSITQ